MTETQHFYYTRSILGRWKPEKSATHPAQQRCDGKPLRYVDHRELGSVEAELSLTDLARRHRCTLNKPLTAGKYLEDPTKERDGEQIGGGFFVFRRGTTTGRIRPSKLWPFEHPTLASAEAEAQRLANLWPGQTFAILQQVAAAYAEPVPEPHGDPVAEVPA